MFSYKIPGSRRVLTGAMILPGEHGKNVAIPNKECAAFLNRYWYSFGDEIVILYLKQ